MRWRFGATEGELVAGGNGWGSAMNQLHCPSDITVDGESLLIVDTLNHRIMRWRFGATVGEIIFGGNGQGNALNQLTNPMGIAVDGDSILIAD